MLFDRLHERLDAFDLHLLQSLYDPKAFLRRNPASAAIGDQACRVECAEISSSRNIVGAKFETDAGGLKSPATDSKFEGVVAKKREMAWPGAGRYTGQYGNA